MMRLDGPWQVAMMMDPPQKQPTDLSSSFEPGSEWHRDNIDHVDWLVKMGFATVEPHICKIGRRSKFRLTPKAYDMAQPGIVAQFPARL